MSESFVEKFLAAADFIDEIEISRETKFKDMPEWDSVAALSVIVLADLEYAVTITGDDFLQCTTVGDLEDMILSRATV